MRVRTLAVAGALAACSHATAAPSRTCLDPPAGLPADVFCTGLYVDDDATKHAPGAMPYTPGVTLWSDGAEKHRFLYLPPGAQIDTSKMDAWSFPPGTKAWKEFRVDGVLVETRLFWKRDATTWASGTYVWDAAGKEATLDASQKGTILASGYEIPATRDCGKCHHGGADSLLGVEAVALALPTAVGVTLASLASAGSLTRPPATTSITLPEDATGKAGAALGFLHANCGMPCHSARGLGDETQLVMRLRADELWPDGVTAVALDASKTETYLATVMKEPTTASVAGAFPGAHRITPGAHDQSLVWLLSSRRGNYQMPPLVSHQVDVAGTAALAAWIDAIPH